MAGRKSPETNDSPYGLKRVECPEPVEGLSWIYILYMRNGMFYIGQTRNVALRIQRHGEGSGSRQARQLKDIKLVYVEGPVKPDSATKRERQLKKGSRAKKLALIRGEFLEINKWGEWWGREPRESHYS